MVTNQKEGRRATELPDTIAGLQMPGYDYLWNIARGRNQDPIITLTPDCEPLPCGSDGKESTGLILGQEDPLEKVMATYSSMLKATFLFPPNSVSVLFIWLRWTEKAKNLVSKRVITIGAVIAVPFSKLPYAEMGRKRIQQNWLVFFLLACQMWKWLTSNDKYSAWPDYGRRVRGYFEKKAWNCCTSWEFLLWQVKLYVLLCLFL